MELIDTGKCVITAQRNKGVNSRQLAKIANTSPQQVLRWRKSKNMKIHTIQLICLSLDITIDDFISFGYKQTFEFTLTAESFKVQKVFGLEADELFKLNIRAWLPLQCIAPEADRFLLRDRLEIRYEYELTAELQKPSDRKFTFLK